MTTNSSRLEEAKFQRNGHPSRGNPAKSCRSFQAMILLHTYSHNRCLTERKQYGTYKRGSLKQETPLSLGPLHCDEQAQ